MYFPGHSIINKQAKKLGTDFTHLTPGWRVANVD